MKFAGELRIPEVDHPGIPASVLVEDTQIEIVLDGESIGRWSLFDVRARRLISKAFALDLAGEEVVFLAEEPVDFAYRGVEHMAQIWAQLKSMRGPQRMMAVRKSRSGTKVSRVEEVREAMEANLRARLARPVVPESEPEPLAVPQPTRPPPNRAPKEPEPEVEVVVVPDREVELPVGEAEVEVVVVPDREVELPVGEAEVEVAVVGDTDARSDDRQGDVKDPVEETERTRFERLQAEAAARDQRRIEAFRSEMGKLESERAEAERLEADRAELFQKEMDRLKAEMRVLKSAEAEASAKDADKDRSLRVQAEIDRIEESRLQLERLEAERLAGDQRRREAAQARRAELERQEAERWEAQRRELDRLRTEATAVERAEAARRAAAEAAAARAALFRAEVEPEESGTTDELETDVLPGLSGPVVDSADEDDTPTAPADPTGTTAKTEPAPKERGLLGAVKGAFSRGTAPHDHDFVTAPGSLGISRFICTECGFVSIGTPDE